MQQDMQHNGIGYVQWNIALEDDEVFWLLPASHNHPDSAELQQALLDDPCAAIPGGVPIKLRAGDGVVYSNVCLHWGSHYSSSVMFFRRVRVDAARRRSSTPRRGRVDAAVVGSRRRRTARTVSSSRRA